MSDTESVILYYGPNAQTKSALAASQWGRLLGSFGHPRNGLSTEIVRDALEMIRSPSIGDDRCSVVVGPMDLLTQEGIVDIFLKTLEENNPKYPRPYLWAWDLGSVRPTIQSRCLMEWCPGQLLIEKKITESAKSAVQASLSGSVASLIEAFNEVRENWKEDGDDFLVAVAQELSTLSGVDKFRLWSRVRELPIGKTTCDEALAGFLL